MAFFPRDFYAQSTGLTPIIRFLNDVDSLSRPASHYVRRHHHHVPTFQPRFDVRELDDVYELHGELPGLDKKDVQLEFSEPQTLVIRGRVERTYQAGTPPAGLVEDTKEASAVNDGDEEKANSTTATPPASNSHQATVEDDDEDGFTTVTAATPATTVAEPTKTVKSAEESKPADKAKYWISERSVGEFARTFKFASRVNQDDVAARLEDGILTVVIPKAPKHETRRIDIA